MSDFVELLQKYIDADPDLTESGLAKKAGLNNSTIRQMIKYNRSPRIDNALKICKALGMTIEGFMAGSQDPVRAELLFLIDQLSSEELHVLRGAARGIVGEHSAAEEKSP
jgi:transcriptional regulator with XRE-family HTH domain